MLRNLAACGAFVLSAHQVIAATPDELRSLLDHGKAKEAYQQARQTPEQIGDPAFDFTFGVAAIEAGHAGEAVLAFERYLLNYPDNLSARLQLARAYFALGEDARAREEFEELRKLNPDSDVAATINRYLDAIRLRETRYTVSTGLYIEMGIGNDSNVNAGVDSPNIFLPNLGDVVVAQSGTRTRDKFGHLGAGGYISYPVAPGISLFGNAQAELKADQEVSQFNQGSYAIAGGVSFLREKHLFRLGLDDNLITLGSHNERYRTYYGASGEWQYQIDEHQAFSVGTQLGRLRYAGANSAKDAKSLGLSSSYKKLFSRAWQPFLTIGLNAGREDTVDAARQDLARDLYGGRISLSLTPAAKWGLALGCAVQNSRYLAPDLILGVARDDRYSSFDVAVSYLYSRNLSFRLEAISSRNRSNIDLYAFPRDIISFKVRYEFR